MKSVALVLGGLSIASLVIACSGSSDSGLFAPPGASTFGTTETDPTETPPSNGGAHLPGKTDGNGNDDGNGSTSSTSSSSSSTSSSGGNGSSSSSTSSTSSSSSGSTTIDAGPAPTDSKIQCGGAQCNGADQVCCMSSSWSGGTASFECQTESPVTCLIGTKISCDEAADCGSGQVCCGMFEPDTGYSSIECKSNAACKNAGDTKAVRFCNPSAPNACAPGKTCSPSISLPGFHYCQ